MPTDSFLIIANPTSGRGRGRRIAEQVAIGLRATGRAVDIQFTQRAAQARELAQAACVASSGYGCIVASGGDGTIQQVAGAIAESRLGANVNAPLLGLAPAGRCNDFAREFAIRPTLQSIMDTLVSGATREVDLGRVNGRFFCTVCTVGIDAQISSYVDKMKLPVRGTLAYVYAAIRVLMSYKAPLLLLRGDFGTVEQAAMLASSANTRSYGGAIELVPHANPSDGMLNVCLIDRISRRRALLLIPTVTRGRHLIHPNVHFMETRGFTIEADRRLEVWADGERVTCTPATVEIVPKAVRLFVPSK
ncbi:MAG: diacylglycerol kinase family lipid kinase [Planctomycetes bacterium]|nr:diacylglycerol kinase family lipid kinase [Planctomycetota bacterium]